MVRRRKTCMKPELFNKVWLLHERWQLLSTIEKGTDNIARFLKNIWRRAILILTINKSRFPAIIHWTYGEVYPRTVPLLHCYITCTFSVFLSATCHQPLEIPVFKGVLGWWQMGGRWQQRVLKRC